MKEPRGHYQAETDEYGLTDECMGCDNAWPCPTWQRWTKSKDYRIKQLEDAVQRLGLDAAGNRKELANLREAHRRLELLVRAGVMVALRETGNGSITESVTREYVDVSASGWRTGIPGLADYTVTFTGRNSKWVNGELSETWYP